MALAALACGAGADVIAQERCGDELNRLSATVGALLAEADLVVVTGGASIGERDFARAAFAGHGLALSFRKVAIRPGKPVWLGRCGGTLVLGLPGNPTSAMVAAALFLRPLLRRLQGGGAGHE